jgi:ribosomal protein L29
MEKPLIQIDDEVREMTDEEFAEYLEEINSIPPLPEAK